MQQKSNCFLQWEESNGNLEHQILGAAFEQVMEYAWRHVGIGSPMPKLESYQPIPVEAIRNKSNNILFYTIYICVCVNFGDGWSYTPNDDVLVSLFSICETEKSFGASSCKCMIIVTSMKYVCERAREKKKGEGEKYYSFIQRYIEYT